MTASARRPRTPAASPGSTSYPSSTDRSWALEAMQELRLAAEAAKVRLSSDERTALTIPFDRFTYHREITRAELEKLVERLVDSTLTPCRMALADAGLAPSDVDEVV